MSTWYEPKEKDFDLSIDKKDFTAWIDSDDFGNIYVSFSIEEIIKFLKDNNIDIK